MAILASYYVIGYFIFSAIIKVLGQTMVLGMYFKNIPIVNHSNNKFILASFFFISGFAGLTLQWISNAIALVVLFSTHLVFSGVCVSVLAGTLVNLIPTQYR